MRKITCIIFLWFLNATILYSQTWDVDDIKEYKIENADLIVELKITTYYYMTDIMTYSCEVIDVKKGYYFDKQLAFEVTYIGDTKEVQKLRWEKLSKIKKGETITLAFRKHDWLEGMKLRGKNYAYFMTE